MRGHIDWKDALMVGLGDPGVDASVLNEFRTRPAADKLTFAERTANTHVSNIVTKVG
ncbi:MAG TPA: hypothetical protein VIO57_00300 [Chloroflexota bacterium]